MSRAVEPDHTEHFGWCLSWIFGLNQALNDGAEAASAALQAIGQAADGGCQRRSQSTDAHDGDLRIRHLWLLPSDKPTSKGGKFWVDFQNDVTAADLELAVRENFRSVEHIKRYTTLVWPPTRARPRTSTRSGSSPTF